MQPFHELLAELVCGKLGQLAKLRLFAVAQRAQRVRSESSSEAISLLVFASYSTEQRGAPESFFKLSRATCNCSPSSPSRARDEARPQQ